MCLCKVLTQCLPLMFTHAQTAMQNEESQETGFYQTWGFSHGSTQPKAHSRKFSALYHFSSLLQDVVHGQIWLAQSTLERPTCLGSLCTWTKSIVNVLFGFGLRQFYSSQGKTFPPIVRNTNENRQVSPRLLYNLWLNSYCNWVLGAPWK